jgi:phosphomannomutase
MGGLRAKRTDRLNIQTYAAGSLGASLDHTPVMLAFGTSGRRGLLNDLSQLEVYLNALGEIEYLKSLDPQEGGIRVGDPFYFAADLRPSSTTLNDEGRGGLAQAICRAIQDAGLTPIYLGTIPTPALTAYAIARKKGSIMVTGSHIPFDRNGFKTNTAMGELLKHHEQPISGFVQTVRERLYTESLEVSLFNPSGTFKTSTEQLPERDEAAALEYQSRYLDFFGSKALAGLHVLVYQHSAVGRELVPQILEALGARVTRAGKSDVFVPIDTENVDAACLATIQSLLDEREDHGVFDAVVSTDGDSDRPLILGVDAETGKVCFFGGDLVGMITAGYLNPDAIVVPISCNDAIDRSPLANVLEPKTRIGSPFVIQGMLAASDRGCQRVVGWEANGGFLTGSVIEKESRTLTALPTRDAMLPIIAVLAEAASRGVSLQALFATLPPRYSRAALIKNFPRNRSQAILEGLRIPDASETPGESLAAWRELIAAYFRPCDGFARATLADTTDGIRIFFESGEVAHLRPSGNADELRIYAVADSQDRADAIASLGVSEPDGILRILERDFAG